MEAGGLCDLRMISRDMALRTLLEMEELPSSDAFGRWLRRVGGKEGGVDHLSPAMDRVLYTNRKGIPEWMIDWYNQRGDESQCCLFRTGVLATNLFLLLRGLVL